MNGSLLGYLSLGEKCSLFAGRGKLDPRSVSGSRGMRPLFASG